MRTSQIIRRLMFAFGLVVAGILFWGLTELFLHLAPPKDLHPYLGEESPITGSYRADESFGYTYRSWKDFHHRYRARFACYPSFQEMNQKRTWAFFGNSFVHMKKMLCDRLRVAVPERIIFNLTWHDQITFRLAQIEILLNQGCRPKRIFFLIMPIDIAFLGWHRLSNLHITEAGALTYKPNVRSEFLNAIISRSRAALATSIRLGMQDGNPGFSLSKLEKGLHPRALKADLRHLLSGLKRVASRAGVPVTVMLFPDYYRICRDVSFAFQDEVAALAREQGFDVFDPRDAFLHVKERESLFVPDKHYSERGNRILVRELLLHMKSRE